jgi:hypothetical protein
MSDEAAEDVVVVQAPVHYPIVRVPFRRTKNTFVVMSEAYEVNSIAFVVVGVYLFTSLKIIEGHRKVLTSCDKVLSIM